MAGVDSVGDQVIAALRRIARAIDLHSHELQQQCGLTVPQLLTMRALIRMEPLTIGALAEAVSVSQATMSGIVDRLEQQALLTRSRGQPDRRSIVIASTPSGRQFVERAPSILQDRFRNELSQSSADEQQTLLTSLQAIARMMGADELTAAPILTSGPEALADPDQSADK